MIVVARDSRIFFLERFHTFLIKKNTYAINQYHNFTKKYWNNQKLKKKIGETEKKVIQNR